MTGQYNVRNYVKFGMLDRGQTTLPINSKLQAMPPVSPVNGNWAISHSPQHLVLKNPVFGNTPARVAPMKTGNESIAASSIQCLSSTANKRTTRTVNTVPRYAPISSVTLSRRTKRTLPCLFPNDSNPLSLIQRLTPVIGIQRDLVRQPTRVIK